MSKFQKGKSGNPRGRPKGRRGRFSTLKKRLESKGEKIVDVVVGRALEGDSVALRICMERLIPVIKPGDEKIDLKHLGKDPIEIGQNAVKAMVNGTISVSQAELIISVANQLCSVLDYKELESRMDDLEEN